MDRFFDIQFKSHKDLMDFLNKRLKPNEKLVSVYVMGEHSSITAIFERIEEKSHIHDYVVVNYNQKSENNITPTRDPIYCGACTTMFS